MRLATTSFAAAIAAALIGAAPLAAAVQLSLAEIGAGAGS